nr:MAG TPA: hypothetical protein [Caudoviricetes sp.]DAT97743.1 MAG TPA: hypothetical protein [Caudoviricetes sp.]
MQRLRRRPADTARLVQAISGVRCGHFSRTALRHPAIYTTTPTPCGSAAGCST